LRKAALSKIISPLILSKRALKPLCAIYFGLYVEDKGRYLGEKMLEKYLFAHSEAFLEIKRAYRCKMHMRA
jgi:hypothetical protein